VSLVGLKQLGDDGVLIPVFRIRPVPNSIVVNGKVRIMC
jgi:hypothetical protein